MEEVVDALHFEKVGVHMVEKECIQHLSEHERGTGVLAVFHGAPIGRVRRREPNDEQAVHAKMHGRPHRRVEAKPTVAVNLVANFDRREDERNRSRSEHVVLADASASNQSMETQAFGNSKARGGIDEDHRLPRADVRGAHGEGPERTAPDVLSEPPPADVSADESGERPRVEDAARLAGAAEKHAIEAGGLAQPEAEHVRQLEAGPDGDELLHPRRHVTDGRCDEGSVDGADAGAGDQVDLWSFSVRVQEFAEDVLERSNLIRSARTTS